MPIVCDVCDRELGRRRHRGGRRAPRRDRRARLRHRHRRARQAGRPRRGPVAPGLRHQRDRRLAGHARPRIPHLAESQGAAAYLSSVSASLTPPWPGLGSYAVSKAALDKLVEAWRAEHPQIGFTRVVVGDCAGGEGESLTEFANGWDRDASRRLRHRVVHPQVHRRLAHGRGGAGRHDRRRAAHRRQRLHPERHRRPAAPAS